MHAELLVEWQPAGKPQQWLKRRRGRKGVECLSELCCVVVADHIHLVESLIGIPQEYVVLPHATFLLGQACGNASIIQLCRMYLLRSSHP
jgi:hypothetical protein